MDVAVAEQDRSRRLLNEGVEQGYREEPGSLGATEGHTHLHHPVNHLLPVLCRYEVGGDGVDGLRVKKLLVEEGVQSLLDVLQGLG